MSPFFHTRRQVLALTAASLAVPRVAHGATATEITWDDLLPPGIAYPEIIGEGEMDIVADTWNPVYDENAVKLNEALDGKRVRLPGYIIPLVMDATGVTDFLLVPYVGACIHVPPPPPNQLVFVTAQPPWPSDKLWDAVWVTGQMSTKLQSTDLGQTGYEIRSDLMEIYVWE